MLFWIIKTNSISWYHSVLSIEVLLIIQLILQWVIAKSKWCYIPDYKWHGYNYYKNQFRKFFGHLIWKSIYLQNFIWLKTKIIFSFILKFTFDSNNIICDEFQNQIIFKTLFDWFKSVVFFITDLQRIIGYLWLLEIPVYFQTQSHS